MRACVRYCFGLMLVPLRRAATDLGSIGPTYPIAKPHLLDLNPASGCGRRSARESLQRLEEQAQDASVESVTKSEADRWHQAEPKPRARSTTTRPSRSTGTSWTTRAASCLLPARARTRWRSSSLSKHLLFFDARDARQVTRAKALIQHYSGKVKPILVGGSYLELMKSWRLRVYYDQHGMLPSGSASRRFLRSCPRKACAFASMNW